MQERASELDRARSALRLRLAGAALGLTLLVLSNGGARESAGAAVLAYTIGAILIRFGVARGVVPLATIGIVLDVIYASALTSSLASTEPAWALYAFAIANASQRWGAWGAVAATAGAVAAYDIVLGARSPDARASDLWPIQVILAIGLLCTELVLAIARTAREQGDLRAIALAQRDVAAANDVDEILSRVVSHAALTFSAKGAWIERRDRRGVPTLSHMHGVTVRRELATIDVPLDDATALVAGFAARDEHREALVADLAAHARPLLAAAKERAKLREQIETATRLADGLRALSGETEISGVLTRIVVMAASLGGAATLVRRSDGGVLAGDALPASLVSFVRDTRPPIVVTDGSFTGTDGRRLTAVAAASAGPGLVIVLVSPEREIDAPSLRALELIGAVAGGVLARMGERDVATRERAELREETERLQTELRSREETLASTVHELRTPLTSVTAYGQLISRNLQSALQQLAQLDRLIGDLRRDAVPALTLAETDLLKQVKDAAQRQRLLTSANVTVAAEGEGPFVVRADVGRLGQVLDNLLGNAVKFSPKDAPIDVAVRRVEEVVLVSIVDEGRGLSNEDLERVFERYYRSASTSADVPGLGIGLAVSRDIVTAHGGRIWAESAGVGRGSTFTIALPAVAKTSNAEVR